MQKALDLSIKYAETGTLDGGYSIPNWKTYSAYMNNHDWGIFVADMQTNHRGAFDEYDAGSGGELKPKGKYPPKMASYGSSSRMIYNLCKDIPAFRFEEKMPTKVGGTANLDGYMETEDTYYFVEAKCREPYGEKSHLIEKKYEDIYNHINDEEECIFHISIKNVKGKISVTFSTKTQVISTFDIKQMICHLLGIAYRVLNHPTKKKLSFLYLCYNPKLIAITDAKKENEIIATYEKLCAECASIDFAKLFESIIYFLKSELKTVKASDTEIAEMCRNFSFALCDQGNFTRYLL